MLGGKKHNQTMFVLSAMFTHTHTHISPPITSLHPHTLTANDTRWAGLVNLAICVDSLKISNTAGRVRMGEREGEGEDGRERRKGEDGEVGGRVRMGGREGGGRGMQEG